MKYFISLVVATALVSPGALAQSWRTTEVCRNGECTRTTTLVFPDSREAYYREDNEDGFYRDSSR